MNLRSLILSLVFSLFTLTASAQIDNFTDLQAAVDAVTGTGSINLGNNLVYNPAADAPINSYFGGNIFTLTNSGGVTTFTGAGVNNMFHFYTYIGVNTWIFDMSTVFTGAGARAFATYGDSVFFNKEITFKDNPGGGLLADESPVTFLSKATFTNNSVNDSSGGGALYSYGGNAVIRFHSGADFNGNSASAATQNSQYGGAIFNTQSSSIFLDSMSSFINNYVSIDGYSGSVFAYGGAIANNRSAAMTIGDSSYFISNSASANNINGTADVKGGAIYVDHSQLTLGDDVIFLSNTASSEGSTSSDVGGGAISLYDGAVLNVGSGAIFRGNTASTDSGTAQGGALFIALGGNAFFKDGAAFERNKVINTGTTGGLAYGGAIMATSVGSLDIGANARFTGNSVSGSGYVEMLGGGAVALEREDSTFGSGVLFKDNYVDYNFTSLLDGKSVYVRGGGLMNVGSGSLTIGAGARFEGNSLRASFANDALTTVAFNRYILGGGMYNLNTSVQFGADTVFLGNSIRASGYVFSAEVAGGGLYAMQGDLTFGNNAVFSQNSVDTFGFYGVTQTHGGGLKIIRGALNFTGSAQFSDNFVRGGSAMGGGIFAGASSNITIGGAGLFTGNKASFAGGAVALQGATFTANGETLFYGNIVDGENHSISKGGALYAYYNSETGAKASFNFNNKVSFIGNEAKLISGGATQGGAIFADGDAATINNGSVFTFADYVLFDANTASGGSASFVQGGAIFSTGGSEFTFSDHNTFTNNKTITAAQTNAGGGAIAALGGSKLTFGQYNLFDNNSAYVPNSMYTNAQGGAIYLNGSAYSDGPGARVTLSFDGFTTFTNNSAQYGGAIYSEAGDISFGSDVLFRGNTATSGGAAIYSHTSYIPAGETRYGSLTFGDRVLFDNNNSIYSSTSSPTVSGALYSNANEFVIFGSDITFQNNSITLNSTDGGSIAGAAMWVNGSWDITRSSFVSFEDRASFVKNVSTLKISPVTHKSTFFSRGALWFNGGAHGKSSISFGDDAYFEGNGAVAEVSNIRYAGDISGGALWTSSLASVKFGDRAFFKDNYASLKATNSSYTGTEMLTVTGGALNFLSPMSVGFGHDAVFVGNKASINFINFSHTYFNVHAKGGAGYLVATYANSVSAYTFGDNAVFAGNSAEITAVNSLTPRGVQIQGGALYIGDGFNRTSFNMGQNAVFYQNSLSLSGLNNGDLHGGALFVNNTDFTFGDNVWFEGNTAVKTGGTGGSLMGGAMFITYNSKVSFGENAVFKDNELSYSDVSNSISVQGGALALTSRSEATFGKGAHFEGNKAAYGSTLFAGYGGAVNLDDNANITFTDGVVFKDNGAGRFGGAAHITTMSQFNITGGALFEGNSVLSKQINDTNPVFGGALGVQSGSFSTLTGDFVFRGNSATAFWDARGGAIGLWNSGTLSLTGGSYLFEGNSVNSGVIGWGGAIFASESSNTAHLTISGSVLFRNNSVNINNTQPHYAFLGQPALAQGGAVYINGSGDKLITFTDSAWINNGLNVNVTSNTSGNNALMGGALYVGQGISADVYLGHDVWFEGNYAKLTSFGNDPYTTLFGGAIALENATGSFLVGDNATFMGNYLSADTKNIIDLFGGAIYKSNGYELRFGSDATFYNNGLNIINGGGMGPMYGGAVYVNGGGNNYYGDNAQFVGNYIKGTGSGAALAGGAYYGTNFSGISFGLDTLFAGNIIDYTLTGNTYTIYGGALAFQSYGGMTFAGGAQFNSNGMNLRFNPGFNPLSIMAWGGAVYTQGGGNYFNEDLVFNSNYITAVGTIYNDMQVQGGALYAQQGYWEFGNGTVFFNNAIDASGLSSDTGNVYIQGGAARFGGGTADFNGSVHFEQNFALGKGAQGGALHIDGYEGFTLNVNMEGENGGAYFLNNESTFAGGALSNSGAMANFNAEAQFFGNRSALGGAVYTQYNNGANSGAGAFAQIYFNSTADFSGNTATTAGGAVHAAGGSSIYFNGKAQFVANSSGGQGGAVFNAGKDPLVNNSMVVFTGGVEFGLNTADTNGGALANTGGASFAVVNNDALFAANTAGGLGGGVFNDGDGSYILFDSGVSFEGNNATSGGGAYNSVIIEFNGDVKFLGNKASSLGGGYYGAGTTSYLTLDDSTKTYEFTGNTAWQGGAIALTDGASMSLHNAKFTGNYAIAQGGAVYLDGTAANTVTAAFHTDAGQTTEFTGNGADGLSNALHIGNYSEANFHSELGGDIHMRDGMTSGSMQSKFYFDGDGEFYNYGAAQLNDVVINGGGFNLMNGGAFASSGLWEITAQGVFRADNGASDVMLANNFTTDGDLYMDFFASEQNDQIVASGEVTLGANSVLYGITDIQDNMFRKKLYKIINYSGLSGEFSEFYLNGGDPLDLANAYQLDYGTAIDNWITLAMEGTLSATNFSALGELTFNQRESASAIDYVSEAAAGDLDNTIALVEAMSIEDQRAALGELSPYFLANVISSRNMTYARTNVYDRVYNHCVGIACSNNGFWAQAQGGRTDVTGNVNSPEDFKQNDAGVSLGWDRFNIDGDYMFGILGRYNDSELTQGANKADTQSVGLGLYGGVVKEKWEVKAMLGANYNTYDTKRYINFMDRTAAGVFDGLTAYADAELAYKFNLAKAFAIKPYAGLNVSYTLTSAFKETGADSLNMDVASQGFTRSAARAGLGLGGNTDKFVWHLSGGINGFLGGTEPEISVKLVDTDRSFLSRGAETEDIIYEGRAGLGFNITKQIQLFANASYMFNGDYKNYYGNAGLRFAFCAPEETEVREVIKEVVQYVDAPAPLHVGSVVEITSGYFALDSAMISPTLRNFLILKAKELNSLDYKRIIITGHTDNIGSGSHNLELSSKRAKAVADFLISQGVPAEKIGKRGKGFYEPKYDNGTEEGRAGNRRVELVVE